MQTPRDLRGGGLQEGLGWALGDHGQRPVTQTENNQVLGFGAKNG